MRRLFPALYVALLLLLTIGSRAQELPADTIQLMGFTSNNSQVGDLVIVELAAHLLTPSYGFGGQIVYDASVVEPILQESRNGSTYTQIGGMFNRSQLVLDRVNVRDDGLSEIDFVYTMLKPDPPVQGQDNLVEVTFRLLKLADTKISLANPRVVQIVDGLGVDVPISIARSDVMIDLSGNIIIPPASVSEAQPNPPLIVLAMVMIVSALIGLVLLLAFAKRGRERLALRG